MSALNGLILVETAERVCGEYCGKLLSDLGAEVIKVERPGGAPTRHIGPFHEGESTLFGYLGTGKKSVELDLSDEAGRATLESLLGRAHGLIDDHWPPLPGLDHEAVTQRHPSLVHCLITPFGMGAPDDMQIAGPLGVINAGGWAWHTPSETSPDRPPLKGAGRFLSDYEAGIDAAIAMLASLQRRRRTGKGQFIDLAEVRVQVNRNDCVLDRMLAGEIEPSAARTAYDMGGPGAAFAARDGHVFLLMTTRVHWQGLCSLMGHPDWAKAFPDDWLEFHCTPDRVALFREHFSQWIAAQDKIAITEAAQKAGVAMVPVNTAADLPENPQFIHRGFFQTIGKARTPGVPYRMSATPVRIAPAPALGADN